MRPQLLLFGALLALGGCTHDLPPSAANAPPKSTAQLMNTYWKLTQLGEQVLDTPAGAREVHVVLHSENQRVAGYSGCNRMMGSYALDGDKIQFDQIGGTMMACASGMELEKKFLTMFPLVARWKIDGETLRLQDAADHTLAVFESRYLQ